MMKVCIIGLNLAKNTIQAHGVIRPAKLTL